MSDGADRPGVVMIDGIAVECHGDPASPPVLLSAGLGGSGAYWAEQVGFLSQDYRVVIYDHRGTGRSTRAPLPDDYDAGHLADDILAVLDGLDLPAAHIVGHAAGAIAGLEFVRRYPDRAMSLAMVNGWAVADPHFIRCFEIRMAIYDAGGPDAFLKAQPLFLYPASWISRHLATLDAERTAHAGGFQDRSTLKARIGALASFDARGLLKGIETPTLVVVSEDDMLVPPHCSTLLADTIPWATYVSMPWGGHAANVTDPVRFNRILSGFLAEHREPANY